MYFKLKGFFVRNIVKLFKIKNMSHKEFLPSDNILLQMKELAFKYLSKEENNWIIFDIAENKIITKHNCYNWYYKNEFNEEII